MKPQFPTNTDLPQEWLFYLKKLHEEIYPNLQQYHPIISNLTGGSITGGLLKQNRIWVVSVTITGNSSAAGASFTLPFNLSFTSLFKVDMDGEAKFARVQGNTILLPDWTSKSLVIISGTAGE